MSGPQATQASLERPKLTFLQKCRTMRGQQIIVTIVFLILPLLLLFTFTYLPFFKMVQFSFYGHPLAGVGGLWGSGAGALRRKPTVVCPAGGV